MSKLVRCAIYTRKSSEEGLEQDFNSLHAQREACAAYVMSQAGEGWSLMDEAYDDGGISGGTLERPGLRRLLADIAAKRIDIVVVYKVDRLTRSLLDFAKLVEAFDAAGTSFVSVTQSFNTTTSMGRLTLNMLLSFAQFEREVTAERIRDKIAASKARGMWMGGTPPLGYAPDGRTLVIVDTEAALVRDIYQRYLDTGNVRLVAEALERTGIRSPTRVRRNGAVHGNCLFTRGQLHHMLRNPVYAGMIGHKGNTYDGLHPAIIERVIWDRVQATLNANIQGERRTRQPNRSLLAGKLVDERGEPLIAVHACKHVPSGAEGGTVRYRYYISRHLQGGGRDTGDGVRIPARELERAVASSVVALFDDPLDIVSRAGLDWRSVGLAQIAERCAAAAASLRGAPGSSHLPRLLIQIKVLDARLEIMLSTVEIGELVQLSGTVETPEHIMVICDASFRRTGHSLRLVQGNGAPVASASADPALVRHLIKARRWWKLLAEGELDVTTLAAREGVTRSYLTRIVRLAFLAPSMVEAIMAGALRSEVDVAMLTAPDAIPASWEAQETKFLPAKAEQENVLNHR